MLDFSTIIFRIPAFLFAIAIHEYAHAQCAVSLGDPTNRYTGRLTLNPFAHLDPLGAMLLVFCGFGWAKPVEFDSRYFKNPQSDTLKVSLAGPFANLFLCFLAMLLWHIMVKLGILSSGVRQLLQWMVYINVWFAFFNLIPIPPLDGYRLITMILPPKMAWNFENVIGRYGIYILIALICLRVTDAIIRPLSALYITLCETILRIIF